MHAPHLDTLLQQRDVRLEGAQLRLERGEAALGLVDPGLVVLVLVPPALQHNFRWMNFQNASYFIGLILHLTLAGERTKFLFTSKHPLHFYHWLRRIEKYSFEMQMVNGLINLNWRIRNPYLRPSASCKGEEEYETNNPNHIPRLLAMKAASDCLPMRPHFGL